MVLANLLGKRPVQSGGNAGVASNSFVSVIDGDSAYDTEAEVAAIVAANDTNTAFTLIWEKTVPAGQKIAWGHGNPNQQRNQGYMWFAAVDEGTGFDDGTIRLQVSNARGTRVLFVAEMDGRELRSSDSTTIATAQPSGIDNKRPLPYTGLWVKEDSKLQIYYRTNTATTTVNKVNFSIPVTILQ